MFSKLDCAVDTASNGLEGLKMASDNADYHIIFVDIGLPDISGFEVIKKIRLLPYYEKKAIIALTGYSGKEERDASYQAGASLVLCKPITIEQTRGLFKEYSPYET
jgi:CheY-like chemotaxis protein